MDKSTTSLQISTLKIIAFLFLIPVLLVGAAVIWLGFCEARKAYWDHHIRRMCEVNGGVKILEPVTITKSQYLLAQKVAGHISIAPKGLLKSDDVVFSVAMEDEIKRSNPRVIKREESIKRRVDEKLVASIITYSRIGGDFPTFAHPSYFSCPDAEQVFSESERVFIILGD